MAAPILKYDLFIGNLAEFVDWWNSNKTFEFSGKYRIVYLREIAKQPDPVCVEYVAQRIK